MNARLLFIGVGVAVCVVALVAAGRQRQQILALRAEQQRLASGPDAEAGDQLTKRSTSPAALHSGPPVELLELRGEVTRLKSRQRELAAARVENEQLRAQAVVRRTNSTATPTLPAGYILRSKAQWKGFNTPDDTIQSFLWAVHNRDLTNLLQVMTPEMAQQVSAEMQRPGRPSEDFFEGMKMLPGMLIVGRTQETSDRVLLQVEMVPGMDKPEPMHVRLINGQWKLEMK